MKFTYDKTDFIVRRSINNSFAFYASKDGKIEKNLSLRQWNSIIYILSKIQVHKESSIFLRKRIINNRIYYIFYDKISRLHWWWPENEFFDSIDDNVFLNFRYNNYEDICYLLDAKSKNSANKFINIKTRIGAVLLAISLLASSNTLTFNLARKSAIEQMKKSYQITSIQTDNLDSEDGTFDSAETEEYNFSDIEKAINDNENLTDSEKDFIKKLKFVFDEDHQYMDYTEVKERMKTLKIIYRKREDGEETILGRYNRKKNIISILDGKNFEEADKRVIIHELGHAFTPSSNGYIYELVNSNASREIFRRLIESGKIEKNKQYIDSNGAMTCYNSGYSKHAGIFYYLLKILPLEARKQYRYKLDPNIITNELEKIDREKNKHKREKKAQNLIDDLNELKDNNTRKLRVSIYKELNYYYKEKYNMNIEENLANVVATDIQYNQNGKIRKGISQFITEGVEYSNSVDKAKLKVFREIIGKKRFSPVNFLYSTSIQEDVFSKNPKPAVYYFLDYNEKLRKVKITEEMNEKYRKTLKKEIKRRKEKDRER